MSPPAVLPPTVVPLVGFEVEAEEGGEEGGIEQLR
jgi:hypothetical protein